MSIESIKKLIKEGDIPQARSQLRKVLAKTPEDVVAQMLYGTCCEINAKGTLLYMLHCICCACVHVGTLRGLFPLIRMRWGAILSV